MLCQQYRELIIDRLAEEMSPEQAQECAQHEQECAVCRAELAHLRQIETFLRDQWPAEDPPPLRLPLVAPPRARGLDLAWMWLGRGSAAVAAACLLMVVLLRPSIEADRTGFRLAFAAPAQAQQNDVRNTAEMKRLVDEQVKQAVAREVANLPAAAPVKVPDVAQLTTQVRLIQQSQTSLWQELQQDRLYLESLWRNSNERARPASFTQ